MITAKAPAFVSTQNPCKVCAPFGATLALAGVAGAVPLLHGSQGCSTYIRRYMIGHFREPMDVASSNFHESAAVFGGRENLTKAIANVVAQYAPSMIGVATTCLAETIGDNVAMYLHELRRDWTGDPLPPIVAISTPSYRGSHTDGFRAAVRAVVEALAEQGPTGSHVNVLPPMVSPADLRYLREIVEDFGVPATILPDYADRLDGPAWRRYERIPPGGTPLDDVRTTGAARATIEFGGADDADTAGTYLAETFGVPRTPMPLPIGVRLSDRFFETLTDLTGAPTPSGHDAERGRLLDAMVDGHKYVFDKRAVIYGAEELVIGLAAMMTEIGVAPVILATGGKPGRLRAGLQEVAPQVAATATILEDVDFHEIGEHCKALEPELLIGNSNGYKLARQLDAPLVRVGMPIHDRIGAAGVLTVGYRGARQLYDRIVNALIRHRQDRCPVGYGHM